MEFLQVVKMRHSIRAFIARPVEPDKLQAILEAANCAPSAGTCRRTRFTRSVVARCWLLLPMRRWARILSRRPRWRSSFAQTPSARPGGTLNAARRCIVSRMRPSRAATALGLASVWVGAFDDDAVRDAIGVGQDLLPVAILPIGYAGEEPQASSRRSLTNLVHHIL